MRAPGVGNWQEIAAELAREWKIAEIELIDEAMRDLYVKYNKRKSSLVGETAMIVDDSKMLRMFLEDCLKKAGVQVTERAENGYDAVKLFNSGRVFDYVFLNVAMPELDGIDALLDFNEDRTSKIIMVTSTKAPDLLLKSIQNGAHHVLYQPFEYGDLLSVLCDPNRFSPKSYERVKSHISRFKKEEEITQRQIFYLTEVAAGE